MIRIPFRKTICIKCKWVNVKTYDILPEFPPTYKCMSPHTHKLNTKSGQVDLFDYCRGNILDHCWHYKERSNG